MASYVILGFDTTPPQLQVYAPRYTTNETLNTITIESNEPLGEYQDIYIIDNSGTRHNLTFQRVTSRQYVGNIILNFVPNGIVSLYARMKDDVDNFSNVVTTVIEVRTGLDTGFAKVSDAPRSIVEMNDQSKSITVADDKSRTITIIDDTSKSIVTVNEKTRKVIAHDAIRGD